MFETTGVVDRNFYNEIKGYIIPPKHKKILVAMTVFAALYAVLTFILKDYILTVLAVVMALVLILEYFLLRNRTIKINLKRMVETDGKDEATYTVSFAEDGVAVQNHATNANATVGYENFVRLAKCKSAYVLFTKAHQFVPVFIEALTEEEKNDLIGFLKSHAVHLKMK